MNLVKLSYSIILDTQETWSRKVEFEAALATWLNSIGLQAEFVITNNPYDSQQTILITKQDSVLNPVPDAVPDKTVKQAKADLSRIRGEDGKFE